MIEIDGIERRFGKKRVLDGVSASFPKGLTLLVGPSGAGKSTLLRILATADKANAGTMRWKGEALPRARRSLRGALGYCPQAVDFPETLTAREFILHMAALKGLALGEAEAQFVDLAQRLGLADDIDRPIQAFSGGMRRRLNVAQALLGSPEFIALDEPTAELDADSAAIVEALLIERCQDAAVVMTTHRAEALRGAAVQTLHVADGAVKVAA